MIADNPWLTSSQKRFLPRFFALEVGKEFFLTGGTALAAFYLHHRISVDLGLFTLDDLALAEGARLVPVLVQELDWELQSARHTDYFHRFVLRAEDEVLQVDLVREFGPQFGQRRQVEGIIVDSLENIAANKLTAILGRSEPKDFVDLYWILQSGWSLEPLLEMARQKDTGLTPFYLAGAILPVQHMTLFPATNPPVNRETLVEFFIRLAESLIDQSNPLRGNDD